MVITRDGVIETYSDGYGSAAMGVIMKLPNTPLTILVYTNDFF